MSDKLENQIKDAELLEQKIHFYEDRKKSLEARMKKLTRSERTHRLITRGAMLETYLPAPEQISDEQVSAFLKMMLSNEKIKTLTRRFFENTTEEGEEKL